MKASTRLIHSVPVDELTGAISVPIYQTSTFVQEAPGVNKGYDYARSNNPTRAVLEQMIADLEAGYRGFAFASGLSAIDAVVKLLQSGDEIIAVDDIYGGAFRQFTHIWKKFGITVHYVDTRDVKNIGRTINNKTKLIWIESPTNPTLKVSDIAAIAQLAKAKDLLLCVDNTFATPWLQQPLQLGADIVIHSATKYLGGHSDLIAGLVVVKSELLAEQIKFIQNACGAILSPHDSWLVIRGIDTLGLRMKLHCENAKAVAAFLEDHPAIDQLYYADGGIVSFSLKEDSEETATKFVTSTRLFKLAESLGGVKSLCCHPASMTHKSIPPERRREGGVADSLVRLSVGLEDAGDLIEDIRQALEPLTVKKQLSGKTEKQLA